MHGQLKLTYKFTSIAAVAMLLISGGNSVLIKSSSSPFSVGFSSNNTKTGLIVPLYSYPTAISWYQLIDAKKAHPQVPIIAVINPSNGPGNYQNIDFVNGIKSLESTGIIVLGYVHTSYAGRTLSSVELDISKYHKWYAISGIMFDEMSNVPGHESYYSTLNSFTKSLGYTMTVGNPGANVPSSYIGTLDVLNVYESDGLPKMSSLASWTSSANRYNFSMIAYGAPTPASLYVSGATSYVAWMYITDAILPNPYNAMPSYLTSLVQDLATASPPVIFLSLAAKDFAGDPLNGIQATISTTNGTRIVYQGNLPLRFDAIYGENYTVAVSNSSQFLFAAWSTRSNEGDLTISAGQNATITAYFVQNYPQLREILGSESENSQSASGCGQSGLTSRFPMVAVPC